MAKQSQVWFTSDPHFRHRLVAGKRGFFAADGTPDTDAHDNAIVANWNKLVAPRDTVWVLGDITLGRASLAWPYVDQLNGVKHLITGNHDAPFGGHHDACKHQRAWMDHFESVQAYARRRLEGHDLLLSHFPYDGDHGEDRYVQYRLQDDGETPVLHGHTHADKKITRSARGTLQIHVGLDAHGLHPAPIGWVQQAVRTVTALDAAYFAAQDAALLADPDLQESLRQMRAGEFGPAYAPDGQP